MYKRRSDLYRSDSILTSFKLLRIPLRTCELRCFFSSRCCRSLDRPCASVRYNCSRYTPSSIGGLQDMQFRSHWETTTSRDHDYLASKPTLVCSPHNMLIVQRKVRVRHTRSSRDPHASRKSKSERRKPTLSHVFFSFSLPFRFGFRIHDQDDRIVNVSLFSMSPVKRAGYCSPKHETRPSRRQCYSPCSTLITHLESDQLFVVDHQPRVIVPDAPARFGQGNPPPTASTKTSGM